MVRLVEEWVELLFCNQLEACRVSTIYYLDMSVESIRLPVVAADQPVAKAPNVTLPLVPCCCPMENPNVLQATVSMSKLFAYLIFSIFGYTECECA